MVNTIFVCHQTEGFITLSGIKIEINNRLLFFNFLFFSEESRKSKSRSSTPASLDKLLLLSWLCSTRKDDLPSIFLCSSLCLFCYILFKRFLVCACFYSLLLCPQRKVPFFYCLLYYSKIVCLYGLILSHNLVLEPKRFSPYL